MGARRNGACKNLIKPGDVFVDAGANLGYYTLLAIRVGASHAYAFEAQPSTHELLGKNVIINWMTKSITLRWHFYGLGRSAFAAIFDQSMHPHSIFENDCVSPIP